MKKSSRIHIKVFLKNGKTFENDQQIDDIVKNFPKLLKIKIIILVITALLLMMY